MTTDQTRDVTLKYFEGPGEPTQDDIVAAMLLDVLTHDEKFNEVCDRAFRKQTNLNR